MSKKTLRSQLAHYRAALTVLSDKLANSECPLDLGNDLTEKPPWCTAHVEYVDYYGECDNVCNGCGIEKLSCWEAYALNSFEKCSLDQLTHKPRRKYTPIRRRRRGDRWFILDY